MAFVIKQGDTSPAIQQQLLTADREAVNLDGCTVAFHLRGVDASAAKVVGAATIVDLTTATVKYQWVTGDTDTAGDYYAEWEVTYADGNIETFPNSGYTAVSIPEQLA